MAQSVSPVSVIEFNGKQFVSGLFWQPLTRPRGYMAEAREIGKREGMDVVSIREAALVQAGFVSRQEGALKGMYSLATTLAGCLGSSWIGAFALDGDRFAFVAVHEGLIVPGCDLIGDRSTVVRALRENYSSFVWEKVYAPGDFSYGGEAIDLQALLVPGNLRPEYRLKSLTFGLSAREWRLAALLVVGLGFGAFAFHQWRAAEQRKAEQARLRMERIQAAQLAALNANSKAALPATAIAHPWAAMPAMIDFSRDCTEGILRLPPSVKGWPFDTAKCDGKTLSVAYIRGGNATVAEFLAEAVRLFHVQPDIYQDGDRATLSLPISIPYGGNEALLSAPEILLQFTSHFQKLGIKPEKAEKPAPPAPGPLPGQDPKEVKAPPPPPWHAYTFGFTSKTQPTSLLAGLPTSGLRLTEVSVALGASGALSWSIKGEIYGL